MDAIEWSLMLKKEQSTALKIRDDVPGRSPRIFAKRLLRILLWTSCKDPVKSYFI